MNNKANEPNKIPDHETFLRIFYNVKRCKGMDWEEKIILSNFMSYQTNGKEFYQTDSHQASELGLSPAQISKYTSRLKERGEIETNMTYVENPNGGRPVPKRYVTVLNMDKWTKGESIPVVKKITSPTQRKLTKRLAEVTRIKEELRILSAQTINPPTEKEVKIIEPAIKKVKNETASTKTKPEVMTLDNDKDVDNSNTLGKIIIAQIREGKEILFHKVKVKLMDELIDDEATLIPNGKNKHYLKSTLRAIDSSVFE